MIPPISELPDDLERLAAYRAKRSREADDAERRLVDEVLARRALGQELTERDLAVLAYSPYGTAAGCACR